MKIGVQTFVTDETMPPSELATELEARGFDCFVQPEHPHVPVAQNTPYPEVYGGQMPEFYKRPLDPFVGLSFAAASSERLLIGTGICLVAFRDPVITAKSVASLDLLSGGRFVFGVGFGWNADEFETHGVDFKRRFSIVREKVAIMKEIWQQDVASYSGEFFTLAPSWSWPKPLQKPHPPVWVGGNGPTTMAHAAEWGDLWYPTPPLHDPTLEKSAPAFRRMVEERGRDPEAVGIGVGAAAPDPKMLAIYRGLGVTVANLRLYSKPRDEALRDLDEFVRVREQLERG